MSCDTTHRMHRANGAYRAYRKRAGIKCAGIALSIALAGCSVTGLDSASDRFHCDAPKGVPCSSTSGVYANSIAGTLPRLPSPESEGPGSSVNPAGATTLSGLSGLVTARRVVPGAGQAIRSLPRQLRVLVFPWVDADNDLHDQSYLYMAVDPGRWLIEHTRAGIRNDAPVPRLAQAPAQASALRDEGETPRARADAPQRPAVVEPLRGQLLPGVLRPGLTESPLPAREGDTRGTASQPDED